MHKFSRCCKAGILLFFVMASCVAQAQRQMESLGRGLVAVRTGASQVYVGWRLFGTDPAGIGFNIYRGSVKVNELPVTNSTNYLDNTSLDEVYTIKPVVNGIEQNPSKPANIWSQQFTTIPLQVPAGGTTPDGVAYTYSANDCSVGDLDGDGEYEIIVKWDPSNAKDNSQSGYTGNVYLDAYTLGGASLWRIDLGRNIRAGAHYTQFMVYDLDGDGKGEIACKTADGTTDGKGVVIGNGQADYRNASGYVLTGPEYLTIFNGETGRAMATTNYLPARGTVSSWGDNYGNRVDRFIAAVAYLDGKRPSLVMGRGYYTRLVRVAWDWRNGELTHRWTFDSNTAGNNAYSGQGNHQLTVGDVDGDGKDEICNGSSAIDDDGTGLYANGLGHGDALHMTDMDPGRPGQEVWQCHEEPASYGAYGLEFRDAKSGQPLWGVVTTGDVGRAMASDIDPRYKGYEVWGSSGALYDCKGNQIGTAKPSVNFGIWWDGDLSRELLDGTKLDKWNYTTNSLNRLFTVYNYGDAKENNGTKANPGLTADILGDWREEMIFRSSNSEFLHVFTTTIPTNYRIYTLMHDPQYRLAVAWQNSAYNQPPHTGFYLGTDMEAPPVPNIYLAGEVTLPVQWLSFTGRLTRGKVDLSWTTASEMENDYFVVERAADGEHFATLNKVHGAGTSAQQHTYSIADNNPLNGKNYYRLQQTDRNGKSTYSAIILVQNLTEPGKLQIHHNPANRAVRLSLNTEGRQVKLMLSSPEGQLFMNEWGRLSELNHKLNDRVQGFPAGVYLVSVYDRGHLYTEKLINR